MTVNLNPNEVVLRVGDTSQQAGDEVIEGKLIVTNQRIYFRPLDLQLVSYNLEILFENILEVIYYSKGLVFGVKGLNVVTRDGKNYTFPLSKRDEIGKLINSMY